MKLNSQHFPLPLFPRRLIAIAAFALCAGQAQAIEPFTVKDIRVEGIQRTEVGTVFGYLPVRVGDTFTDEKGTEAIKALYATGFFKDVRIEADGNVLVILIEERPAIASVEFSGVKEFEKDVLIKALKVIGLGESRIFDRALVDRAEQELKRQYLSRGLYGVEITTTVTPIERNRVNVNFAVYEGDIARIKKINFIGNKAFKDKTLLDELKLSTSGWFTWYTKKDQYSKPKLTGDIESLKSFYVNQGYIEMQIDSTQVSITPDKKDIYITININEGEKYTVSDIKLEGQLLGREAEFKSLVELKKGELYSGEKLAESVKKISDRMGNFGYAFANVNANPELDRENRKVAFTIYVDPGKRVYIRRINIGGNTVTRDEVIRREWRQFEGSWYDANKIKLSRERLDRLGYFNEVNIETPEVIGTSDQVDVNVAVVEKPTGNISLGAGYSNSDKVTLSAGINQSNVFGSGNTIGMELNTSKLNRTISLSHTNPYFTDDGVSRSFDLYYRTSRPPVNNIGDYIVATSGANIRFGIPFTERDTVFLGAGVEKTNVTAYRSALGFNDSPVLYQTYVDNFGSFAADGKGKASTVSIPLTAAWLRDSRNSVLTPATGRYQRANLELSALGDLHYYRAVYQDQLFQPLFKTITLALNGEVDYGRGFGGKPYPVFKNFYAGGLGSVRGYSGSSLGPRSSNGDSIGGTTRIIGNVELQFPFPGAGKDRSLQWYTFLDGGTVYAEGAKIELSELRYSAGLGISWISPIGPLKIGYGKALNAKAGDKLQAVQFQLGTGF